MDKRMDKRLLIVLSGILMSRAIVEIENISSNGWYKIKYKKVMDT